MIERAQLHVNAFDSLAAGLAAGLKEDSIDSARIKSGRKRAGGGAGTTARAALPRTIPHLIR